VRLLNDVRLAIGANSRHAVWSVKNSWWRTCCSLWLAGGARSFFAYRGGSVEDFSTFEIAGGRSDSKSDSNSDEARFAALTLICFSIPAERESYLDWGHRFQSTKKGLFVALSKQGEAGDQDR